MNIESKITSLCDAHRLYEVCLFLNAPSKYLGIKYFNFRAPSLPIIYESTSGPLLFVSHISCLLRRVFYHVLYEKILLHIITISCLCTLASAYQQ
jgi:hypothetical protein